MKNSKALQESYSSASCPLILVNAMKNDKIVDELLSTSSLGTFFGVSQEILNQVWEALTHPDGNSVLYISMEIGADPDVFHPVRDLLAQKGITSSDNAKLADFIEKYQQGPRKIPNYSGGLGVLAGDTLKSFADLKIPVVAVSLLYREGYFSQFVDSKVGQIDQATCWSPEKTPGLFPLTDPVRPDAPLLIAVPFINEYDQQTYAEAQVWCKLEINAHGDYFVPELLLDYSVPGSPPWVQEASRRLYESSSSIIKANQRRMLGSAVLPLMKALGLTANTIHLNEQHGVVVALHLVNQYLLKHHDKSLDSEISDQDIEIAIKAVSQHLVYTIHTPVKAGHDRFDRSFYSGISQKTCRRILDKLAQDDEFPNHYNFTNMAMRVNRSVNSVSRLHRDVTRRQFPKFAKRIKAITNGVHHLTWISPQRADLFNRTAALKGWRDDPGVFANNTTLESDSFREQLWQAWDKDNQALIDFVNEMLCRHRTEMSRTWIDPPNYLSHLPESESCIKPGVLTIGFARRFSTYKRADLIFDNLDRLAEILVNRGQALNFLFAGKAHPADEPGKSVLKLILDNQKKIHEKSNGLVKLIFIPGYDMKIAKLMVAGVHAWLNSPKRPLEASGTSGMKAALNGAPNISIMDGWWVEGFHQGKTGWKFGHEGPVEEANLSEDPASLLYAEDSESFYKLLPLILDAYYDEGRRGFMDKAIKNLQLNMPIFNTHRMAAEYVREYNLSLPARSSAGIEHFQSLYRSDISANLADNRASALSKIKPQG